MMKQRIKDIVDHIVVEREYPRKLVLFEQILELLIPYALQSYMNCRDIIQYTLGQMERIPIEGVSYFFVNLRPLIETLRIIKGKASILDYINVDWNGDMMALVERVGPHIAGEQKICDLRKSVADDLTFEERRFLTSSIIGYIQGNGVKSQWGNDIFQNAFMFCNLLYPICKKDDVMDLLFHSYNNIIDRLNTSGHSQHARDLAEGVLVVGYNEGMIADAYFSACRAYTGAHNIIAGLLFYYISLLELNRTGREINERFACDIYWQYLKICRLQGIYPQEEVELVEKRFKELDLSDYDRMSFYHTLFTTKLFAGKKYGLDREVTEFLDKNREAFYKGLNHGAMPWISLLASMQDLMPNGDYNGIMPYVQSAKQVAYREGNELLFDIVEENNLARRLKELMFKLNETRSRSDYAMDNHMTMVIAKKLLSQSYTNNNVPGFLLAMSPKSDFSIVMPMKESDNMYRRFEIDDVNGEELASVFESPAFLAQLLAPDDDDTIIWIGKGKQSYMMMNYADGGYRMTGDLIVSQKDINTAVVKYIWSQRYDREVIEPGTPIYVKSDGELEEEGKILKKALSHFVVDIPIKARRVLFIKDLEIASYPHQLFTSKEQDGLVGALVPTCNVMSSELLVKTNLYPLLPKEFTKSFWIPYGGEEFTFDVIYGKLEDVIKKHQIKVQNQLNPQNPICGDIVLLCAHGGNDISSSEVFYVNDKPILDTLESIGEGRIALLLICYSGTISHSHYDNAMHTLVKKLIQKGYSSVVAPMWSMPTQIITSWISTFMESMERGDYIVDAVFKANMVVKKDFVAPSAWACLHLFGNPYMRVGDGARVVIKEKL